MKRLLCFMLITVLFAAAAAPLSAFAAANPDEDGFYSYTGYNQTIFAAGVVVFTSDYGETTGTDDRYYEITIENGTVTAVGGNDSDIPEAGFVLAARGENYKTILAEVAVGDCVILDTDSRRFGIIGDDYDPFYSAVISFDGYNRIRNADTIIIYDTGDTTGTNIWGTEVCVDSDGFICSIGGNNNVIPEGGFVISAVGAGRIAELTDAAGIGLRATADAEKKTITFSYSAESIRASLRITLEGLKERYAEAANTYSIIDYKTAEELIDRLEKLYELVCDRLDDGDIGPAIGAQYSFESLTKDASLALTESPAVEGRAMWLRPSGLTTVEAVSNTVAEIKSLGYNIICLELLYDSTFICPMPEDGYFIQNPSLGGFDLLGAFIDECASQGIELQGWLSVYRVSYDTSTYYSESLAAKKPEWLCISKSGNNYVYNEYGNGYFINPANEEACDYLLSVYEYLMSNYRLDALQLDYIRYPYESGEYFGYDEHTRDLFKAEYGADPADITAGGAHWDEWIDFRCDIVTDFVKRIVETAAEKAPWMSVSADIAPNLSESRRTHLQDAEKWMKNGIINSAFPMAYGNNVVPMYAGYTVEACGDDVFSYIGLGNYGSDVYIRQISEVREAGADGFAFFSYAQYIQGDYRNTVYDALLSIPAVSPTYDCRAAAVAQIGTITERLSLISGSAADSAECDEFAEKINEIKRVITDGKLSDAAELILKLDPSSISFTNETAEKKLSSDIALLKKITVFSRDDHRVFVYADSSVSGDESVSGGESDNPAWYRIVITVTAVIVIFGGITVLARKKGNKEE